MARGLAVVTGVDHGGHVELVATELVGAVRAWGEHEGDSLYALLRLGYLLAELSPQLTMLVSGALRSSITSGTEPDIDSWRRILLTEGFGQSRDATRPRTDGGGASGSER